MRECRFCGTRYDHRRAQHRVNSNSAAILDVRHQSLSSRWSWRCQARQTGFDSGGSEVRCRHQFGVASTKETSRKTRRSGWQRILAHPHDRQGSQKGKRCAWADRSIEKQQKHHPCLRAHPSSEHHSTCVVWPQICASVLTDGRGSLLQTRTECKARSRGYSLDGPSCYTSVFGRGGMTAALEGVDSLEARRPSTKRSRRSRYPRLNESFLPSCSTTRYSP
jgi:hypothetical protein